MNKEHIWKIAGSAILFLLSLAVWFAQSELTEMKTQNKLQWQEAAKTKELLLMDVSKTKERLAHLEGYHAHESECREKSK
jgi:hypothetical protein